MEEILSSDDIDMLLPTSVGSTGTSKSSLLCIAEILRLFTDPSHGIKASELRDALELRMGHRPSEGKVLDDLHEIIENEPFGMHVVAPSRGEVDGFRCESAVLSSRQARLLINMVQTCKFVTPEQRRDLLEALHGLVSYRQQDLIADGVRVDKREVPADTDAFLAADVASEAIRKGRRISFHYVERGLDGAEVPLCKRDGSQVFVEDPVALLFSFGHYYLETVVDDPYGDGPRVFQRRLDKVRQPELSATHIMHPNLVVELRESVDQRITEVFDMWGDGVRRTLFLRTSEKFARYVFDRFGDKIVFRQRYRSEDRAITCVVVQLSPTFYRWLFGMGGNVTIHRPESELWATGFMDDIPSYARKAYGELVADYDIAIKGYRELIQQVLTAQNWE